MKSVGISPLIEKYSAAFEKDKTSRVFAPLAEGYRQAGLIDKAMEIIKIGIRHNPTYIQGYLTLSSCYMDLEEYNLAYTTLRPLVSDNRDNIRLQKIFASSCVELDHKDEALESYKYLLFLNPKDEEVSKIVADLEKEESYAEAPTKMIASPKFEIDEIEVKPDIVKNSLDEWIKVDLKKNDADQIVVDDGPSERSWNMTSLEEVRRAKSIEVKKEELELVEKKEESIEEPVITHSLVDLYISQGHLVKAKELLLKIIELNPNEASSLEKLKEVDKIESASRVEVEGEEEGHQRLLDSLDAKLGLQSDGIAQLQNFLDAIQKHAEDRKNQQI